MPPRVKSTEWSDLSEQLNAANGDNNQTNNIIKPKQQQHDQSSQLQQPQQQLQQNHDPNQPSYRKLQLVWRNIILMSLLHIGAFVGIKQCIYSAQWKTIAFGHLMYIIGGLGITAGAHRLWSHRSYKANWAYRCIIAVFNSVAFQNSIYEWCRDHRVHHKFCETDADPHDARRGFFFSHVGWLLCRKHPDVKLKGKTIDMSDLEADPIVRFQHQNYLKCVALCCFIIPTLIPYLGWGETLFNSFYICAILKYVVTLHCTWLVNSAAHMWGRRPYDEHINPAENRGVSLGALGEGFHNYHHVFPWDYATSELGYELNVTKMVIDGFAKLGWVYERKMVSPEMIRSRKLRTGDVVEHGQYGASHEHEE